MGLKDLHNEYVFRDYELLKLTDKISLNKYLSNFENVFKSLNKKEDYLGYYKWMSRSYRCSKHIISSTLFYAQTQYLGKSAKRNLTSYTMYYSLYHAVSAVFVLFPHISFKKLVRISHRQCITYAETELSNRGLMPKNFKDVYNYIITLREMYSYKTPLTQDGKDMLSIDKIFNSFCEIIPALIQLANIISIALNKVSEEFYKNIEDKYDDLQIECDKIFFETIKINDRLRKIGGFVSDDDYRRFGWIFRNYPMPYLQAGFLVERFCEDLECNWWEKNDKNDFEISDVSNYLITWLERV